MLRLAGYFWPTYRRTEDACPVASSSLVHDRSDTYRLGEPITMKRREFLVYPPWAPRLATSALGTVGLSRSALAELVKTPRVAAGTRKVLIAGGGSTRPSSATWRRSPGSDGLGSVTCPRRRPIGRRAASPSFGTVGPSMCEPFVQESFISGYRQTQGWDEVLLSMDGIVASGGNTLNQQAIWKAQGIDTVLEKRGTAGSCSAVPARARCAGLMREPPTPGRRSCRCQVSRFHQRQPLSPLDHEPQRRPLYKKLIASGGNAAGLRM